MDQTQQTPPGMRAVEEKSAGGELYKFENVIFSESTADPHRPLCPRVSEVARYVR